MLGTAFLVASTPGFAMTAAHVLQGAPGSKPLGPHVRVADLSAGATTSLLLHREDRWRPLVVLAWEKHPTEDLALLTFHDSDGNLPTPSLDVTADPVPISTTYALLGYPDDEYWSLQEPGKVDLSLTYSEGHVRRHRQPGPLPGPRGTDILELSTPAGGGGSGAPVFARVAASQVPIPVSAVYIGERRPEGTGNAVGYAVPLSAVAGWTTEITDGGVLS